MLNVVLDMETQDPDDFLTLLLLLDHAKVNLKAITLTPGSQNQVGLVRKALSWFDRDLPIGAYKLDHPKSCVSPWHRKAFGSWQPSQEAAPGWQVLRDHFTTDTTFITGAPLKNLGELIKHAPGFTLGRWVAQGGFAGEGVVPPELQLPKFKGMRTCPTFNLNGAPKAALAALEHPGIKERYFVSKNVCHAVIYDEPFHRRLEPLRHQRKGLELLWKGMDTYLRHKHIPRVDEAIDAPQVRLLDRQGQFQGVMARQEALALAREQSLHLVQRGHKESPPLCRIQEHPGSGGKKLHDPLAACCAINPAIGQWAEVSLFRERGAWGAEHKPGSNTWIIVDYDHERFFQTLALA